MIGKTYNRLLVVDESHQDNRGKRYYSVRCVCGTDKVIRGDIIRGHKVKACGCLHRESARSLGLSKATHRMGKTLTYKTWSSMKDRCFNINNVHYHHYGGRGITVCKEWADSFESFYSDMGTKPKGLTIERRNNNLGYYKENCSWENAKTQANNTRGNRHITHNGKTLTVAQWSDITGIKYGTIHARVRYGWSIHKTLTTPVKTMIKGAKQWQR